MSEQTKQMGDKWWKWQWNPVSGCTPCSPGCQNCYAKRMSQNPRFAQVFNNTENPFAVTLHPERLLAPMQHKKPELVFVCNVSDLFNEAVPFDFINQVFAVMTLCPQHQFVIVTKREKRLAEYCNLGPKGADRAFAIMKYVESIGVKTKRFVHKYAASMSWPLPNVGLMVTVCNQDEADEKIPTLLSVPAAWRGVSYEPALGPVDFTHVKFGNSLYMNTLLTQENRMETMGRVPDIKALDWIVCGGESGPNARPMNPKWARDVRDACVRAGVRYYFKQWGEWLPIDMPWEQFYPKSLASDECWVNYAGGSGYHGEEVWRMKRVGKKKAGRLLDGRTWDEMPEVLA